MAGRRGAAASSAKRTRPAASAGKTTATAAATAAAAALRNDQRRGRRGGGTGAEVHNVVDEAEEEVEEVTLLYRKPSTRGTKQPAQSLSEVPGVSTGSSSSPSSSTAAAHQATPESCVLAFFQRATGPINLTRYLLPCGVCDVQQRSDGVLHTVTQQQLFHCSEDRLETAVQALRNMEALIYTPADTSTALGTPWVGQGCWVRPSHQAAMTALAHVCEAAVPLCFPPLVQTAVLAAMEADGAAAAVTASSTMQWRVPLSVAGGSRSSAATIFKDGSEEDAQSKAEGSTMVDLVPSPVRLSDVLHRLRCLRRLRELRRAYSGLLPRLHAASSLSVLRRCLFSHDAIACQTLGRLRRLWITGGVPGSIGGGTSGDAADGAARRDFAGVLSSFLGSPMALDLLLPFVGLSSRHPHEGALLQHLVGCLRETTAVEAAAWGPMAAMASWRLSDGLYVVQHASRVRALRRLIAEAQFYGLPRFLRSIRVLEGATAAAATVSGGLLAAEDGWSRAAVSAVQKAQGRYTDHFFLTPDALDPTMFTQPDSMQLQLVQEELITLQRTHCAFCLLVGDADAVVTAVQQHLRCAGQAWQHLAKKEEEKSGDGSAAVKQEPGTTGGATAEEGEEGVDAHGSCRGASACGDDAHPRDPLTRYALRTVDAARRHERAKAARPAGGADAAAAAAAALPFSHVQWVEGGGSANRWSLNTHYYGVVYMVVLETDELDTEGVSLMTEGLLPGTAIAVPEGGEAAMLGPPRPVTFCVNALVELWHS